MASGHIQKNISMGLSHFYDIVLALQMITCVLCLVASEGKYLQYIYIYIVKGKHFACGRFVQVELP